MRTGIAFLFALLIFAAVADAQVEHSEHLVTFTRPNGAYTEAQMQADYGNINGMTAPEEARLSIENNTLKYSIEQGETGDTGGVISKILFPQTQENTTQFRIKWDDQYDFTRQMKTMGMQGTVDPVIGGTACQPGQCWSSRIIVEEQSPASAQADLKNYVYHTDMPGSFGDMIGGALFTIQRDTWYTIRHYVKLNTGSNTDGILRVWATTNATIGAGDLVFEKTDMRFVTQETPRNINAVRNGIFHGGDDLASEPTRNQSVWLDDLQWSDTGIIQTTEPTVHFNNYTNSIAGTDVTSLTISNVSLSGNNRGLAVCVLEAASTPGVQVSSVVFNGSENLTFVAESVFVPAEFETEVWYLSNPTATTGDVVITLTGAGGDTIIMGTATGLSNVKQAPPTFSDTGECDACTSNSSNINTTTANTMLLTCNRHDKIANTDTHGTGQTELSDFPETGSFGEHQSASWELKGDTGNETLQTFATQSGAMRMVSIGVEPVGAIPSIQRRRRIISFR